MPSKTLTMVVAALFTVFSVFCADASDIRPDNTEEFKLDIPAQRLEQSLQDLADATGVIISYSKTELGTARANGVSGEMSYDSALRHMLVGSGFIFSDNGNGEVVIRPRGSSFKELKQAPPLLR